MNRTRLFCILIAGVAVLWSGCDPKEPFLNFPHKHHLESGLECASCHEMAEKTVGMPTLESCTSCHDLEDKVILKRCYDCHDKLQKKIEFTGDKIVHHKELFRQFLSDGWQDVRYNHAEQLKDTSDESCLACHATVPESDYSLESNLPTMKIAMAIQEKLGLSNECAICHENLNPFTPPASHTRQWKETHGRMTTFTGKDACLMCHQEATCVSCHSSETPRNHTNQFRHKTHGVQAEFNRSKCMTCHRSDECLSCHQATANAIPAAPYHTPDASCLTCHSPLAAQGPQPRPPQQFFHPMPHRMMMGATSQKCLTCHQF